MFENDAFTREWWQTARTIYLRSTCAARAGNSIYKRMANEVIGSVSRRDAFDNQFGRFVAAMARLQDHPTLPIRQGRSWSPAVDQLLLRNKVDQPGGDEQMRGFGTGAAFVRSVRLGFALVAKERGLVTRGDLGAADMLAPHHKAFLAAHPEPRRVDPTDGSYGFDVVVPWIHQASSRGRYRYVHSRSTISLDTIDQDAAPVSIRLMAGDLSGMVDLRRHLGRLYRPVMAPDSWRPITVHEFAEACAGGTPWVDNPFLARRPSLTFEERGAGATSVPFNSSCRNELAPLDYCVPAKDVPGHVPQPVEAALERAGHMIVIDGTVYRRTSEPVLRVANAWRTTSLKPLPATVGWTALDFEMRDHQSTLADDRVSGHDYGLWQAMRIGMQPNDLWDAVAFPVSMAPHCQELARLLCQRHVGVPFKAVDVVEEVGHGFQGPDEVEWLRGMLARIAKAGVAVPGPVRAAARCIGTLEPHEVADRLDEAAAKVPDEGVGTLYAMVGKVLAKTLRREFDPEPEMSPEDAEALRF